MAASKDAVPAPETSSESPFPEMPDLGTVSSLSSTEAQAWLRVIHERHEVELVNRKLEGAVAEIQTLQRIIPVCMYCKSVRDDAGFWQRVDDYLHAHSRGLVSDGVCPACEPMIRPGLKLVRASDR